METYYYCLDFSKFMVDTFMDTFPLKNGQETHEAQMFLVEQGRKFSYFAVCVNSMTAHATACVWTRMLLGVLTADKRKRTDTG